MCVGEDGVDSTTDGIKGEQGPTGAGGHQKEWMACFLNDLLSFRYQNRPVGDCSPGIAHGGSFNG